MKSIFLIIGIFIFLDNNIYSQDQELSKHDVLSIFNSNRNERISDTLIEDPVLSEAIGAEYKHAIVQDSLRKELSKYCIYDYEIETFDFTIKGKEDLKRQLIDNSYPKLQSILNDSLNNRIGIKIDKKNKLFRIKLIVTHRLIEFSEVSYFIPEKNILNPNEIVQPKLIIKGNVLINNKNVFYIIDGDGLNHIDNIETLGNKLQVENNYSFMIEFTYTNEDVVFYDANGNIIANVSYFIKIGGL